MMIIITVIFTFLLVGEMIGMLTYGPPLSREYYKHIERELQGRIIVDKDKEFIHFHNKIFDEVLDYKHCSPMEINYITATHITTAIGYKYYIACKGLKEGYVVPRFSKTEKLIKKVFKEGKNGIKNIK